jgi:hypothetical protein
LLEKQQQGTGPVKSQALPIIWEEDYNFAEWEKISVWREVFQGHDIPNGEAALKALMPREVARALEDMEAEEVNVTSRHREDIAASFAAMGSWVLLTRAASEAWEAIQEAFAVDDGFRSFRSVEKTREAFDAWREESPVDFQAWEEAMQEARRQNTVVKTWRAAYSEIESLEKRVLDLRISQAVKVWNGWEAHRNFMLLKRLNSLLETAKSKAFETTKGARFMPRGTLILSIFPQIGKMEVDS